MKIAIVGMGVAGSYLVNRMSHDHEVDGFERYKRRDYQCVCAWGTSKYELRKYANQCDLNFDEYILHEGKELLVSVGGIELRTELCGLVTFDKHRFVLDLQRGQNVHFGSRINESSWLADYDIVIDATSLRTLLPKILHDNKIMIPCLQYRVRYKDLPFDDFHIELSDDGCGYLWFFPLGGGWANVGAGDINHKHGDALRTFFERHGGKREKVMGRTLRICPPRYCKPIFVGRTVGVGESIGTVFPLLGEGIIPTLQCADIFQQTAPDFNEYRRRVYENFTFYEIAFDLLRPLVKGQIRPLEQIGPSIAVALHMWSNERRYGSRASLIGIKVDPVLFTLNFLLALARVKIP
jgi:flavin-dependent dehydrogenase